MRLERYRNRTGIDLIQNVFKKTMLLNFIPAVAASDQSDLERSQRHGPIHAALQLIEMLRWRTVEIGGVPPPGNNFKNQMLFGIGEASSDLLRFKALETAVVKVDFKAVKPIACCR